MAFFDKSDGQQWPCTITWKEEKKREEEGLGLISNTGDFFDEDFR